MPPPGAGTVHNTNTGGTFLRPRYSGGAGQGAGTMRRGSKKKKGKKKPKELTAGSCLPHMWIED